MADEQFYTILTNVGKAKVANAVLLNNNVTLKTLKVGDGNGAYYNPTEEQKDLKNTVYTCNVGSVTVDTKNPNWIIAETIIPSNVGGFTIREVGLFDTDGDMIAIGKYPETYKPVVANGASKDLNVRTIFEVSNAESVNLSINPSIIIATKEDINNLQKQVDTKTSYDLINGSLRIAQRYDGSDTATFTNPVNKYIMDRFLCNGTGTVVPIKGGGCTVTGTINFKYWMEKLDFNLLPNKFNITYSLNGVETVLEVVKSECSVDSEGNGLVFNKDISDGILNYVHYGKGIFVSRTYDEELSLCKRYLRPLQTNKHFRIATYDINSLWINIDYYDMRLLVPTLVVGQEGIDWHICSTLYSTVHSGFSLDIIQGNLLRATKINHGLTDGVLKILTKKNYLDAEIYSEVV